MKLSDLRTHDDVVAANLEDPEYRAEWERTRFAHEVAKRVIQYRIDHSLTQAELAQQLGMRQPHVARLEAGEHEPSLTTLRRLAQRLDMSLDSAATMAFKDFKLVFHTVYQVRGSYTYKAGPRGIPSRATAA